MHAQRTAAANKDAVPRCQDGLYPGPCSDIEQSEMGVALNTSGAVVVETAGDFAGSSPQYSSSRSFPNHASTASAARDSDHCL